MFSKINGAVPRGVDAAPVEVETDVLRGMPYFQIVGLADTTVKEAKERIRSAIIHSGYQYPMQRITMNIAPAAIRKRGTILDLAMAVGILTASGQMSQVRTEQYCFLGELSLDGRVRRVPGILPAVLEARSRGIRRFFLPEENLREACLTEGTEIYPVQALQQVVEHFNGDRVMRAVLPEEGLDLEAYIRDRRREGNSEEPDFRDVHGNDSAKRAALIAAAGNHGLIMIGSPASGKSMIAERIPGILPDLTREEIVEVTRIYSAAGLLSESDPIVWRRPFRRPHYSITPTGLIGGGYYPKPGEITLASAGVLFLDEAAEFAPGVLDGMRTPLETRQVRIVRLGETVILPADFLLAMASNPCKCGNFGDRKKKCTCTPAEVRRYQSRLSGPLLDRIDLHLVLQPAPYDEFEGERGMSSAEMKELASKAREIQRIRFRNERIRCNSEMDQRQTDFYAACDDEGEHLLERAYRAGMVNPRSYGKTKRIARTIADLEGSEFVTGNHIAEALQYSRRASAAG